MGVWDPMGAGISRGVESWLEGKRRKEEKARYEEEWPLEKERQGKEIELLNQRINDLIRETELQEKHFAEPELISETIPDLYPGTTVTRETGEMTKGGVGYQKQQMELESLRKGLEPEEPDYYGTSTFMGVTGVPDWKTDPTTGERVRLSEEERMNYVQKHASYLTGLEKEMKDYVAAGEEEPGLFDEAGNVRTDALFRNIYDADGTLHIEAISTPEGRRQKAVQIAFAHGIDPNDPKVQKIIDSLAGYYKAYMGLSNKEKQEVKTNKRRGWNLLKTKPKIGTPDTMMGQPIGGGERKLTLEEVDRIKREEAAKQKEYVPPKWY